MLANALPDPCCQLLEDTLSFTRSAGRRQSQAAHAKCYIHQAHQDQHWTCKLQKCRHLYVTRDTAVLSLPLSGSTLDDVVHSQDHLRGLSCRQQNCLLDLRVMRMAVRHKVAEALQIYLGFQLLKDWDVAQEMS